MEKPVDVQNPEEKEEQELFLSLPKVKSWDLPYLHHYQGFWLEPTYFHGIYNFQKHFQAKDTDIVLATFPKSGTTWLKALASAVVNRSRYTLENSPLNTSQPHDVVPFVDLQIYGKNRSSILEDLPEPRILATHVPYPSLPTSIINSNCRIVYLCRNPLDQLVSALLFAPEFRNRVMEPVSMDETFEMLCQGIQCFGPSWNHVLGYGKTSLERPNKVLFLKYEDLKEDINFNLKKLADFLGCPFTEEEEAQGVIEEISKFCSFENLKNLEVNQTGKVAHTNIPNKIFFRRGEVGDWKNHLTPSMSQRLKNLIEEKLGESDLVTFKYN